jgi:hypothetical protein
MRAPAASARSRGARETIHQPSPLLFVTVNCVYTMTVCVQLPCTHAQACGKSTTTRERLGTAVYTAVHGRDTAVYTRPYTALLTARAEFLLQLYGGLYGEIRTRTKYFESIIQHL